MLDRMKKKAFAHMEVCSGMLLLGEGESDRGMLSQLLLVARLKPYTPVYLELEPGPGTCLWDIHAERNFPWRLQFARRALGGKSMLKFFTDSEMFLHYSKQMSELNIKEVYCRELQSVEFISLFELQVAALGKPFMLRSAALDDLYGLRDPGGAQSEHYTNISYRTTHIFDFVRT